MGGRGDHKYEESEEEVEEEDERRSIYYGGSHSGGGGGAGLSLDERTEASTPAPAAASASAAAGIATAGGIADTAEGSAGDVGAAATAADDFAVATAPAVEPNVVSYNNVITACAIAKKQNRAEGIFREMTKERGLRPYVFTYGALISACA